MINPALDFGLGVHLLDIPKPQQMLHVILAPLQLSLVERSDHLLLWLFVLGICFYGFVGHACASARLALHLAMKRRGRAP